jgi:hypothetical protein
LVLSLVIPFDRQAGISFPIIAAPLVLGLIGAVLLHRRSLSGSRWKNWAGGFAVGVGFLLLLYSGA